MKHVVIITSNTRTLLTFRLDFIKALRAQQVRVSVLGPQDETAAAVQEILGALDVQLHFFATSNTSFNPFHDLRTYYGLKQKLSQLNPDAIFAYTIKPVIYGVLAAHAVSVPRRTVMMSGLGHLYTVDTALMRCVRWIANGLLKRAFLKTDVIFFQNADDAALLQKLGVLDTTNQPQKIVFVPGSGVNLKQFAETPLPQALPLKFLFVGRILKTKGFNEFCQAARQVKSQYPGAQFALLGGYHPNPAQLDTQQALTMMAEAGIEYLGEADDVRPYLAAAHVVVLPSYREGTPKALLEALSIGRPIITTDVPGCREIIDLDPGSSLTVTTDGPQVQRGRNGILVPAADANALSQAMLALLADPSVLGAMAKASRNLAETKFDVRIVNKILLHNLLSMQQY
jgi:glycosyltransferase involved in cell wall biosynthesis